MASTFSDGTTTIAPILVHGFESSRASRNVVHPIIGAAGVAATLRPAGLRNGTLTILCASFAQAVTLEVLLSQDKRFVFADPAVPGVGMTFIANGDIGVRMDEERALAFVDVAFQQVPA